METKPEIAQTTADLSPDPAPVGIFDSGVGGLSVWREIVQRLPHEHLIYVADQAHIPYGSRSLDEIRAFAREVTHFLLGGGAKLIVVACNTASAAALHHLRATFPQVPFVGMEPAVKPASENTHSGVIGVIATSATFQGELFASLVERFADKVTVLTQICPGLVEAVEKGELDSPATQSLLDAYLRPLVKAGIDQLVLGCTHYPFLTPAIRRIVGAQVQIIDPAPAVARQVSRVLARQGSREPGPQLGRQIFYSSGDTNQVRPLFTNLIGRPVDLQPVRWVDGYLHLSSSLPSSPQKS